MFRTQRPIKDPVGQYAAARQLVDDLKRQIAEMDAATLPEEGDGLVEAAVTAHHDRRMLRDRLEAAQEVAATFGDQCLSVWRHERQQKASALATQLQAVESRQADVTRDRQLHQAAIAEADRQLRDLDHNLNDLVRRRVREEPDPKRPHRIAIASASPLDPPAPSKLLLRPSEWRRVVTMAAGARLDSVAIVVDEFTGLITRTEPGVPGFEAVSTKS